MDDYATVPEITQQTPKWEPDLQFLSTFDEYNAVVKEARPSQLIIPDFAAQPAYTQQPGLIKRCARPAPSRCRRRRRRRRSYPLIVLCWGGKNKSKTTPPSFLWHRPFPHPTTHTHSTPYRPACHAR